MAAMAVRRPGRRVGKGMMESDQGCLMRRARKEARKTVKARKRGEVYGGSHECLMIKCSVPVGDVSQQGRAREGA